MDFPQKTGLGISKFLTHVSSDCQDLISKLLIYNPEERYSAKQALNHPFFKDLIEQDLKMAKNSSLKANPETSFRDNSVSFNKG